MQTKKKFFQAVLASTKCTKREFAIGLGILLVAMIAGGLFMNQNEKPKILKIAFGSPWKNVHPGLQHTLIGDLTLSNQFEALVGFNENGAYVPLAAREWTVSPDYTVFTFKIDTSKVFSDGVHLSASDFKNSWEQALHLEPKSMNSSALDVLYKVEGFSDFGKTGKLSGVRALDQETLEVRFATPFRMALEHLSGNRFSAYREVDGKFLGTGAYIIEETGTDLATLKPNPKYPSSPKSRIELSVIGAKASVEALLSGTIDVMAYAMGGAVPNDLEKHNNLSVLIGQEALHRAIYLNAQKGRFFEKKELRQALQYLAYKFYGQKPEALGNAKFTSVDPQIYLPLQAGRLNPSEASALIGKGEAHVDALREAAALHPLVLLESDEFSLRPLLEASGIAISPKSKVLPKSELIAAVYDGVEADIMPGSFGVASGDPDGMYHLLGARGAITSPMLKNVDVDRMLEEGRKIVDSSAIDPFYKKVSAVVLDEAPIVHLGFNKAVAIYRNDLVNVTGRILRRNEGHLQIFEAK
jgi:ABC-type transport system substrate-binding protein